MVAALELFALSGLMGVGGGAGGKAALLNGGDFTVAFEAEERKKKV